MRIVFWGWSYSPFDQLKMQKRGLNYHTSKWRSWENLVREIWNSSPRYSVRTVLLPLAYFENFSGFHLQDKQNASSKINMSLQLWEVTLQSYEVFLNWQQLVWQYRKIREVMGWWCRGGLQGCGARGWWWRLCGAGSGSWRVPLRHRLSSRLPRRWMLCRLRWLVAAGLGGRLRVSAAASIYVLTY